MRTKIIIILAFILFFGGGAIYYYFAETHASLTSPLQPSETPAPALPTPTASTIQLDTVEIKKLGESFFAAYTNCLKDPPKEARGRVSGYCQENTGYTTKGFTTNLKEVGTARRGADPITCSQNPPASIAMGEVDYEDPERADLIAIITGGSSALKIPVQVVKEASGWRVDCVICPRS